MILFTSKMPHLNNYFDVARTKEERYTEIECDREDETESKSHSMPPSRSPFKYIILYSFTKNVFLYNITMSNEFISPLHSLDTLFSPVHLFIVDIGN